MTNITRRTALGLLGAVAVPSAATVAVAASEPHHRSPQERIDAAIADIGAALRELHPDWRLQAKEEVLRSKLYRPGTFVDGEACRHTILISCGGEKYGPQEVRYFTVDLPEDATP